MSAAVDVVVVTSNARELVLKCLAHLSDPVVGRIIVVDNASSDDTAEVVREALPSVIVVSLETHGSLSRAFNRGAEHAEAEYVLFLNDDVFAEPGSIARLREALAAKPSAASAGGRLIDLESGVTQQAYRPRSFPTPAMFFALLTGLSDVWPRNPWSGRHLRQPLDDVNTVTVDQPAGAALLVRRAALERVRGWDECYWFWYEDVDLSRRLAREGYALYVPSAPFRHLGGATVGRWRPIDILRRIYYGVVTYAESHFSAKDRMVVGLMLIALSLPRVALLRNRKPDVAELHRAALSAGAGLVRGRGVNGGSAAAYLRKTAV